MKKVSIIIVDDHKFYRKTLRMIIKNLNYCEVVAEAENGAEFIELLGQHAVDVVFMDIKMPVMNGIEATKIAVGENRGIKIVALTMFEEKEYFLEMLYAGAKGFLTKDSRREEFEKCLEAVVNGSNYYPKGLASNLLFKDLSSKTKTNPQAE